MNTEAAAWAVSTGEGVGVDADELVGVLALHHQRLLDTWTSFSPAQWGHESRNADWTVHQTVRHQADCIERGAAGVSGGSVLDALEEFDARTTPDEWLAASDRESPEATIDRFAGASALFRGGIRDRLALGDDTRERTVYGTTHWTVNVAHLLWDSWLHERDVLLPQGLAAHSSPEEERLVGVYGLLMAMVPSMLFERSVSATVQLDGSVSRTIEVRCDPGSIVSTEASAVGSPIGGPTGPVVDALAGRGSEVNDVLPGAPEELALLANFFNG